MADLVLKNGKTKKLKSFDIRIWMRVEAGETEEETIENIQENFNDFADFIADITGLQEEIEMSGSKGPVEAKIIPVVEMRVNV